MTEDNDVNDKEEIKQETENPEKQKDETEEDYKTKYLYLLAEVDNYKKNKEKELVEYIKYSNEKLIHDLLKVLDDFESVMKTNKDKEIEALMKSLYGVLKAYGLTRMDVIGHDYSPDIAEVVVTEDIKDKAGKIIEEIQPGYQLNGRIIRYPKVKIAV